MTMLVYDMLLHILLYSFIMWWYRKFRCFCHWFEWVQLCYKNNLNSSDDDDIKLSKCPTLPMVRKRIYDIGYTPLVFVYIAVLIGFTRALIGELTLHTTSSMISLQYKYLLHETMTMDMTMKFNKACTNMQKHMNYMQINIFFKHCNHI